ncbi:MAG TPA: hypothetical protein VMX36_07475 [Sedimentisphaerales bacterium]|nr:hypothetical protein [Sedimentisphaerales bacterium]
MKIIGKANIKNQKSKLWSPSGTTSTILHFALFILILPLIGGCRSQQESSFRAGYDFSAVNKVAIVAVEGAVPSEVAMDEIADFFSIELLERGYAPMGRAQVRASLAEQEAEDEITDLTTPEGAVEAGLALDVPVVLTIKIPHFGEEISISATMIDVEDHSILWLATGTGGGGGGLSSIFRSRSGGSKDEGLLGPVMGDVLGSTDQPLSPEDAERAQRIIKRMCRSLPTKQALAAPEW